MRTVTASEAKQGLAGVIEAASREPVMIQRQKRDVAVVLSPREYERLVRLNVTEFQRFCDQVGLRPSQDTHRMGIGAGNPRGWRDRFPCSTLGPVLGGRVYRYTDSLDVCEQGRIFDGMPAHLQDTHVANLNGHPCCGYPVAKCSAERDTSDMIKHFKHKGSAIVF